MNNFLLAIAGTICAILIAAIFAPIFIDWNSFKTEIEAAGRKITGQNVQIVGDVELRILPQPVFHTGGMIITNAGDEKLLETNDFTLELDFPSLLRGKIEVTSMHLNDGKIFISKTNDASINLLNFGGAIGQPIGLDDISIKKLVLNNMDIEFTNQLINGQKTISIQQAEVTARSLIGPYKVKGALNVDANDTVFQRGFSLAVGKYIAEKPLTVKVQIDGEQKRSRLTFLGNLVGLAKQPLLTGQLTVKGEKGENLIGYGKEFGSVLNDDLLLTSDVSISYSAIDATNLKIEMSSKNTESLSESLKINGALKYVWGRNASINGALNVGIADFNYVKNLFLKQSILDQDQAVYQSAQELIALAKGWVVQHVVIAPSNEAENIADKHHFSGNIGLNVEQLDFAQNGVADRVRLMNGLLNIEDDQVRLTQFSANFPGNSKLNYTLSKQTAGENGEGLLTGKFEFNALHLSKLTNWLMFKNQKLDNINDFWGVNDQITSQGNIDIMRDGIRLSAAQVKNRDHVYALDYSFNDEIHDIDVSFDRLSFDNQDFAAFEKYIGGFAKNALVKQQTEDGSNIILEKFHLVSPDILANIGNVQLSLHGNQSYYGIRDLGVFDAKLLFKPDETVLQEMSLVGDKIYITAKGSLPYIYAEKNIIEAEKDIPVLEFSIIDAEMKVTPQLVHDILLDDNLFLEKIIPAAGPLNVSGKLETVDENGGLRWDVSGKIGTSDLDIGAEIAIKNNLLVQNNIQYQLSNENSEILLAQFGLEKLFKVNRDADENLALVRLIVSQNDDIENQRDARLLVTVQDQYIELVAAAKAEQKLDFNGDLQFNISNLGLFLQKVGLFDGNFNRVKGRAKFDAKVNLADDGIHITSSDMNVFDSHFNEFKLDIIDDNKFDFVVKFTIFTR